MAGSEATPPGWYRQPDDPHTLRWWDGEEWTDDEMPLPAGAGGPSRRARPATDRTQRASAREPANLALDPRAARAADAQARARRDRDRAEAARIAEEARRRARRDREMAALERAAPIGDATRMPSAAPRPRGDATVASPRTAVEPAGRGHDARPEASPTRIRIEDDAERRSPGAAAPSGAGNPRPRPGPKRAPAPARTPPPARASRRTPERGAPRAPARAPQRTASRTERSSRVVQRRSGAMPLALRFALRVLVLAVVIGIGYLGYVQLRDAEPERAATLPDTVSAPPEADPDATPISEALITLGSLPSGWATQVYDPGIDDICEGRKPATVIIPAERVSSSFNRGSVGPYLTNVINRFDDTDTARRFLSLVGDTLEACRVHEIDGTRIELAPLDLPKFGDDTYAVTVTGETAAGTLRGVIVYLRVGDRVASVEALGVNGEDVGMEQVELLTRLVARRL